MKMMSVEDFYNNHFKNLKENDLVLDVRTAGEFEESHIKNSKNINHTDVGPHAKDLASNHDAIYIICRRGGRAMAAYNDLVAEAPEGDFICINDGGMERWALQNFSLE